MFSLLGMLGWWMVRAYSTAQDHSGANPSSLTAVTPDSDWTGGLAEQAQRDVRLRKNEKQLQWNVAEDDGTPGVKKLPPQGPPENAGHTASPASPDRPQARADEKGEQAGKADAKAASDKGGSAADAKGTPDPAKSTNADVRQAAQLREAGKFVEARNLIRDALSREKSESARAELRGMAAQLANDTIFSTRQLKDDPLVTLYTIKSGEVLVNIAKEFSVPPEIVMSMNGIADAKRAQAGQTIKIPRGPFDATVFQAEHRLDLFLGDLYVRSYPVGLGRERRTPNGVWKVVDRIPDPTYYPSANAATKQVIPGKDPRNPLGDFWLKLEGIEGDAVGQAGYGIHGTNDPASIGKDESLGCIRMRNEDVAFIFSVMRPGKSTVRTAP